MYGLKQDWILEQRPRFFVREDYERATPRWCPGCGDNAVLSAFQRLATEEQLKPEETVVVSGIGCSSRFPHYVKTYGFHGLHGRPLPVASGVRSRRPDLNVFVVTGDGDCTAIGTAHWIHAIRYNMKMTVMMFDNNIYGLTKMQTSPTTPRQQRSNTHPEGSTLPPLNPLTVTLGITNASFVAQTVDWNPVHLYATLRKAHEHPGLAFVRIVQRCPHYMKGAFDALQNDPSLVLRLDHADGIEPEELFDRVFPNHQEHDPADLGAARDLASREDVVPIGLLYRDADADRYDEMSARGIEMSTDDRIEAVQREIDRFQI